jgi:hypothetical protein
MQPNISEVTAENLVVFSVAYQYADHLHLPRYLMFILFSTPWKRLTNYSVS